MISQKCQKTFITFLKNANIILIHRIPTSGSHFNFKFTIITIQIYPEKTVAGLTITCFNKYNGKFPN